ncbi:APC family permease [Alicyclobacillus tolerans]|uniref:APC family permease n=1 Tax=Alicyclobacillus tolerans TaxID=90970 RepID=UPI001F442CE7|nr:APC family permease [Alicyclobacillus tolerans]MCF8566551.1 APC family permease [Alicyclobacillus tolerans]
MTKETSPAHSAEHRVYQQELKRVLSLPDLLIYGMIFMVPISPMVVYGYVAQQSHGMVPFVYLVGIIAMLFTALSYREMSKKFPIAGSVYSYVQRGLNPHVGFIAGWMILADYLIIPAQLYAFSAIWIHGLVPGVPTWVWVILFAVAITLINVRGITIMNGANWILLVIELIALILFLIFAFRYVFLLHHGAAGWSMQPFYQPGKINAGFIASATSIAALSFLGFDGISTLSEEAKRPTRDVGNATVLALIVLGILFMLQTYVAALVHPNFQNLDPNLGFFQISRQAGGTFLYDFILIVTIIAAGIANTLVAQSAVSRILFAMGRDDLLPFSGFFSKVHSRTQTPLNSTLLVAVISVILALAVPAEDLIRFINFGALTSFMFLNATVLIYFYIRQRQYGHIVRYLVLPLIGFAIITYVWTGFDRPTFIFGLSWLVVGIIVGAIKSNFYKKTPAVLEGI